MTIISLGAGVQSTTMYLMSCNGDLPKADYAIFADTQSEPPSVYEYLEYLEGGEYGIPILRVTQGSLEEEAILWAEGGDRGVGLPLFTASVGLMPRQCTQNYKIAPIRRKIQELRKERGVDQVEVWIGISTDEIERMKDSPVKYIRHRWPLIESRMNRNDCRAYIEYHGYKQPPKSACYFCPFRSDDGWQKMRKEDPLTFLRAVEFDRKIRVLPRMRDETYIHRSLRPLGELDFSDGEQLDLWGNECEGYCGV